MESQSLRVGGEGGAIAIRGGKVFVTNGPIGFDGDVTLKFAAGGTATPKKQPSGQIFEVDLETGKAELFADGFRNLSGLILGKGDTLWSVEHGPRGGDEINHVFRSETYGWPMVTTGTDYIGFTWQGSKTPGRHSQFTKPVYAWVPSIAPSALRRIKGSHFANWKGDFFVSTLKAGHLYRVQFDEDRVMLVEPILVGRRIRDFVEGHDGALYLLLAREGSIMRITAGETEVGIEGVAALNLCSSCHQLKSQDNNQYSGPTLLGILDRKIASVAGFAYSDALESIEGRWTKETLHSFLENPEVFGAGSTMPDPQLNFSQRRLVIKELEALDATTENK